MTVLTNIKNCIVDGKFQEIDSLVQMALDKNIGVDTIIDGAMIKGMLMAAERWKSGVYYIPEVLLAAKCMKAGMEILKPHLADNSVKNKDTFAIGTVKGDLHDIGKNLVAMMAEGGGYNVIDLGVGVTAEQFVTCVKENSQIRAIGMSALLTTTMTEMRETIAALERAELREQIKVFVGGAPVSQSYADEIGADYYAENAADVVSQLNSVFR
jgi:methanogenic corrinoid protein MtbC1